MIRVDGVVGSADDPDLAADIAAHESAGTLETVTLDSADRRKSRLRVETDAGTDLGVLVDKPELAAGDVLVCDDDRAVVVAFESREAFVIELPQSTPAATVELGHRIGNQHWDIAIEERTVYIPVAADKAIIEDVLGPYLPAGTETWYETVDADRFMDDTGADSHGPEHDHDHSHGSDHEHGHGSDHEHGHGSDHEHGHGSDHGHSHDHDGGHSHD